MNEYDDLTTQLTRTLTDHSDAMAGSSLGLAEVQGRARSIRRRRTATAVVGVAAAVALLVPTVALAGHSGATHDEPGPATQTPSSTRTATAVDTRAPLDLRELPVGEPPAGGYVAGGRIHVADGDTGQIYSVADPIDDFALLSDGTAVYHTRDQSGRTSVEVTDSGGSNHGPYPAGDGLAVDATRTSAVWVSPDGQVHAWVATETAARTVGAPVPGDGPQTGGVTGDCSAVCQVLVRTTDQSTGEVTDWLVPSAGPAGKVAPRDPFVTVNDISSAGERLGYTEIGDGTSCSAVVDVSGATSWRTCRHTLLAFSPDADHVSADVAYHSGDGSSVIAAYDGLNGKLLFEHRSTAQTQAVVQGTVWEDDSHLLGVVRQGLEWAVVRFGVDGSMELAVRPVTGHDDLRAPIVLGGARG
jgi:hypothetical protein